MSTLALHNGGQLTSHGHAIPRSPLHLHHFRRRNQSFSLRAASPPFLPTITPHNRRRTCCHNKLRPSRLHQHLCHRRRVVNIRRQTTSTRSCNRRRVKCLTHSNSRGSRRVNILHILDKEEADRAAHRKLHRSSEISIWWPRRPRGRRWHVSPATWVMWDFKHSTGCVVLNQIGAIVGSSERGGDLLRR